MSKHPRESFQDKSAKYLAQLKVDMSSPELANLTAFILANPKTKTDTKERKNLMSERMAILQAEYARAIMSPLFNDPKQYCVLLDLIQDAIDKEREAIEWSPNA